MEIDRCEKMLQYVETYYKDSRFYMAQNNAKGQEFNNIHVIIEDLQNQFYPQKATWGLKLWEELYKLEPIGTIEERRIRILSKMSTFPIITPVVLERLIKRTLNIDTTILRNIEPYTFQVRFHYEDKYISLKGIRQIIEEYKEAHMAYRLLGYSNSSFSVNVINIISKLTIRNECYPRANLPYVKYNGIAHYSNTKRIHLYPIRLHIASEFKSRMFFFPKIQMRNVFHAPIYHTETKVGYVQENKLYTTLEQALQIKLQTPILPRYEINLKIGKHPNRYDGRTKYDGKSRYYVAKIENV